MNGFKFEKPRPKPARAYNPNRFNALDSGIVYVIVLVMFYVVSLLFGKVFGAWLRELYRYDVYAYMIVSLLVSQLTIFAVAAIYSLVRRTNPFSGGGYVAKVDGVQILMSLLLIMGIMMTFYHTHLQFGQDAEKIIGGGFTPDMNLSPYSGIFALIYIALTVLCPAIFEEMLFRGIIMRGLEQFGSIAAIVLSAIAFALMHGNFSQLILQFIGGLAIASVVVLTGNWLIGSIMHGFNNLFSIFYGLLLENIAGDLTGEYIQSATDASLILIGVALLTVSVIYFVKLAFEKKKKESAGKPPVGKFERVKYYEVLENGEFKTVPYYIKAELPEWGEESEKQYKIKGKYRKINRKSPFMASCIVFGAAIIVAIVFIFI